VRVREGERVTLHFVERERERERERGMNTKLRVFVVDVLERVLREGGREMVDSFAEPSRRFLGEFIAGPALDATLFPVAQRTCLALGEEESGLRRAIDDAQLPSLFLSLSRIATSSFSASTRLAAVSAGRALLRERGEQPFAENRGVFESFRRISEKAAAEEERHEAALERRREAGRQPRPSLHFHALAWGETLQRGAYASVRRALFISPGLEQQYWPQFAVKEATIAALREQRYLANARREIAVLAGPLSTSPHTVRLVGSFEHAAKLFVALEFAEAGDVREVLRRVGSADSRWAAFVTHRAALALRAVHELAAHVHLDVKPDNLLLFHGGVVKLGDFGSAWPLAEPDTLPPPLVACGTADYVAPELIVAGAAAPRSPLPLSPTPAADVYSLGVLLYELLHGRTPHHSVTSQGVFDKVVSGMPVICDARLVSRTAQATIQSLTARSPGDRPKSPASLPLFDAVREVSSMPVPKTGADRGTAGAVPAAVRQRKFSMMYSSLVVLQAEEKEMLAPLWEDGGRWERRRVREEEGGGGRMRD
jgi:hypothetical protein